MPLGSSSEAPAIETGSEHSQDPRFTGPDHGALFSVGQTHWRFSLRRLPPNAIGLRLVPEEYFLNRQCYSGRKALTPRTSGLTAASCRSINLPRGEARIGRRELNINRRQLCGLARAAHRGHATKLLELLLSCPT